MSRTKPHPFHPPITFLRPTADVCMQLNWQMGWESEDDIAKYWNVSRIICCWIWECAYSVCKKVDKNRVRERYYAYVHMRERQSKVIQFQKVNHMCVLTNYQWGKKIQLTSNIPVTFGIISLIHCGFNLVKKGMRARERDFVKNLQFSTHCPASL